MRFPLLSKAKRKYKKQYVEKKKTPSGEVRVYDEKHIKKRWEQKAKKVNKLEKDITKLRKKYRDDLKDDKDAKTRALAAIVGLMDNTAMRVGNEASAEEMGTFGATTLLKEHATVSGNKIRFRFKGKKGVAQDVTLDDAAVVSEIKKLLKGKKAKDLIFEYEEGKQIRPKVVNRYLSDFGITAKDIRGFHANHLMKERLKKTKDFDKALEYVADEVGHEAKTLMNQYLLPSLVNKYKKASLLIQAEMRLNEAEAIIEDILGVAPAAPAPKAPGEAPIAEGPAEGVAHEEVVPPISNPQHHVTSPYGERVHPVTRERSFHSGIDLRASEGTPILAFGKGRVAEVSYGSVSGNFVVIDHGDSLMSTYAHLSEAKVQKGQAVSRGDIIGLAGSTGRVTAAHLHFSLRYKGEKVDPTPFLNERTVVGGQ